MFNRASYLAGQTLWLWFLFLYERVSKPCMTNSQSGYNDLFSSWFSQFWSSFTHVWLNLEGFTVDVSALWLMPFCVKEFINCWSKIVVRIVLPRSCKDNQANWRKTLNHVRLTCSVKCLNVLESLKHSNVVFSLISISFAARITSIMKMKRSVARANTCFL